MLSFKQNIVYFVIDSNFSIFAYITYLFCPCRTPRKTRYADGAFLLKLQVIYLYLSTYSVSVQYVCTIWVYMQSSTLDVRRGGCLVQWPFKQVLLNMAGMTRNGDGWHLGVKQNVHTRYIATHSSVFEDRVILCRQLITCRGWVAHRGTWTRRACSLERMRNILQC